MFTLIHFRNEKCTKKFYVTNLELATIVLEDKLNSSKVWASGSKFPLEESNLNMIYGNDIGRTIVLRISKVNHLTLSLNASSFKMFYEQLSFNRSLIEEHNYIQLYDCNCTLCLMPEEASYMFNHITENLKLYEILARH